MRQVIRKVFDWTEGHDYGDGWIMRGMEGFDPVGGNGFAHDCLEHLDDTIGIEAEMRAFGSILWMRGMTGYFEQAGYKSTAADNMSADIVRFLCETHLECQTPGDLSKNPLYDTLDDAEEEIITKICEMVSHGMDEEYESEWDEEVDKEKLSRSLDAVSAWIRYGYRMCERRYGKWQSADEMAWHYGCIMKAFDSNFQVGDVGDSVEFKFNILTGHWTIRQYNEYEESKYVCG